MTIKTRTLAETKPSKTANTLRRALKPAADKVAEVKQQNIVDAAEAPTQAGAEPTQAAPGVALEGLDRPVTGRGVFAVRTLGNAVSVESAFLAEDGNVLRLPAVFPNREYALAQLEELWQLVNRHFDELEQAAKAAQ